jgi:hypothetical protein
MFVEASSNCLQSRMFGNYGPIVSKSPSLETSITLRERNDARMTRIVILPMDIPA